MAPRPARACALAALLAAGACESRAPTAGPPPASAPAPSASSARPPGSAEPAQGAVGPDAPFCAELRAVAPMHEGRLLHRPLRLADGRVLVTSTERAEIFDPKTETWSQAADLPKGLFGYALAALPDGSALLAGSSPTGAGRAFVYEPAAARWRRAAPPKVGRYGGHTLTPLADGTVLLAGGAVGPSRPSGGPTLTGVVERYDPKADAWRPAGRLEHPRQAQAAFALRDGNVMLAGGYIFDGAVRTTDRVDLYETATAASRALAPTGVAKSQGVSGTLLDDGRPLLVTTTEGPPKSAVRRRLQIGDPAAGTWRGLCSLAVDQMPPEPLAVLPGDWLLVAPAPIHAGGLAFVSLREPGGGDGADACSMRRLPVPADFPVASVAATALADGRVLITGGQDWRPDKRVNDGFSIVASDQAWVLTPCRP